MTQKQEIMKKRMNYLTVALTALIMVFTFVQCEEGITTTNPTNPTAKTGQANFEITDAPIDDASVDGVFVTITEIKVDGETYEGFNGKQTINLMNYQEGNTKVLGMGELNAQMYSEITLVLDNETDEMGNAPGCYVATTDGTKHNLTTESQAMTEIIIEKSHEVEEDTENDFVLDFDVRKAITYDESTSSTSDYKFVTEMELNSAVRLVKKEETGEVEGEMNDNPMISAEKVVVFAYKKGTYDENTEVQGQGESNVTFSNAVSSTIVNNDGSYKLAFLEAGDYELHFIAFEDEDNDGKMEAKGELTLDLLTSLGIDLNNVSVSANANVSLNVMITGIIDF